MYISGTLVIPYPGRGREAQIIALAVGSAIETCQDVAEKMPRSRARTKDGEPKHRKGFQTKLRQQPLRIRNETMRCGSGRDGNDFMGVKRINGEMRFGGNLQ